METITKLFKISPLNLSCYELFLFCYDLGLRVARGYGKFLLKHLYIFLCLRNIQLEYTLDTFFFY